MKKKELIIVGDRVLVSPEENEGKTNAGLILPANAVENQPVQAGGIKEVGPGIPIADPGSGEDEPWKAGHPATCRCRRSPATSRSS